MSQANSSQDFVDDIFGGFIDIAPKRKNDEKDESLGNKKVCTGLQSESFVSRATTAMKKVVQRKFPGPAGLLTTSDTKSEGQSWKDLSFNTSVNQMEMLCSQASVAAFNSQIWRRMSQDYSESGLLEKCNIEWIKRNAAQKKLLDQKAPFLVAVIQSVERSFSTVTLVLKDPSGEIQGHMPCKLYKEHTNHLLVGAVVILKLPAVLTLNFGESHYLIITASNLVEIYYPEKNKNNNSNEVCLVKLQNFSADEVLRLISDVEKCHNKKEIKDCGFKTTENRPTVAINTCQTIQHPQTKAVINKTVERQITTEKKSKFDFKIVKEQSYECNEKNGDGMPTQCSQIVIKSQNPAHDKILEKVFDGVDADSFFDDF